MKDIKTIVIELTNGYVECDLDFMETIENISYCKKKKLLYVVTHKTNSDAIFSLNPDHIIRITIKKK